MNKGKYPPLSEDQIVELSQKQRTNRLHKTEDTSAGSERIREIVTDATAALAVCAVTDQRLSLEETDRVKEQTMRYFRATAEAGAIPSFIGLARAFGYSAQRLRDFMRERPQHETSVWLELVKDTIADALAQAALRNGASAVPAIFVLKSQAGWRDVVQIEAVQQSTYGAERTAEEIAAKYAEILPD